MRWTEVYDSDKDEVQRLQDEVQALRAKVEAVREFAERIEGLEFPNLRLCARELRKVLADPEPDHG